MLAQTVQGEMMRWLQEPFWKEKCLGQNFNSENSHTIYPGIKTLHTTFHQRVETEIHNELPPEQ